MVTFPPTRHCSVGGFYYFAKTKPLGLKWTLMSFQTHLIVCLLCIKELLFFIQWAWTLIFTVMLQKWQKHHQSIIKVVHSTCILKPHNSFVWGTQWNVSNFPWKSSPEQKLISQFHNLDICHLKMWKFVDDDVEWHRLYDLRLTSAQCLFCKEINLCKTSLYIYIYAQSDQITFKRWILQRQNRKITNMLIHFKLILM